MLKRKKKEGASSPDKSQNGDERKASRSETNKEAVSQNNDTHVRRKRIKLDLLIHDLKVPLAVIDAGVISLLKRPDKYGAITSKQQKVLTRILRNTKTIQNIVNDALEVGRSREGIFNVAGLELSSLIRQALLEMFDFSDCSASENVRSCEDVRQMKEILASRGIRLSVDEALWAEKICLDIGKTSQILRNLLNNALKYRKSHVELEINKKGDSLIITVKDDGDGIPSAFHEKIFESYFQLETSNGNLVRGHGLGLAGVMVLIEDMGGKLILESDTGKGAKFQVDVPLKSRSQS